MLKEYSSILNYRENETYIKNIEEYFKTNLARELNLLYVSAPIFIADIKNTLKENDLEIETKEEGMIFFDIKETNARAKISNSFVEWKINKLRDENFKNDEGIVAQTITINPSLICSNVDSVINRNVTWEIVIQKKDKSLHCLKQVVKKIFKVFKNLEKYLFQLNECFKPILPDEIMFVSSKDLEKIFEGSIKEREIEIGKIKKAVFITGIGDFLPSGKVHENRKPFYDDWTLNGNIMFYFPILGNTFKMGTVSVRADSETLKKQMSVINSNYSLKSLTKFQKLVVENKVPATIGGKFDISRICMFFLRKAHIGEVVPSIWPDGIVEQNKINNIKFLS